MRVLQRKVFRQLIGRSVNCTAACCTFAILLLITSPAAHAAITWDSQALGVIDEVPDQPVGHGTQWWFDPVNWSHAEPGEAGPYFLPPSDITGANATDVIINGTDTPLPGGEGVVYDPGSDPFFDDVDGDGPGTEGAADLTYPPGGYGPQSLWRLYMGRPDNDTGEINTNPVLLTIKGDITNNDAFGSVRWWIGRSSGIVNVPVDATVVHESGTILSPSGDIDLGSNDSDVLQVYGNGTYDYRGGTLDHGSSGAGRFRLSAGGGQSAGGHGTLIMHNPDEEGYFRVRELLVASYPGGGINNPDGVNRGVAIAEFHFENGGTRAVQITGDMVLANGQNCATCTQPTATRSSRLRLVLDEAPMVDMSGVPIPLGLFDIDSDRNDVGVLRAPSVTPNLLGITFSDADAANPLDPSAVYDEGDIVTAMFGASTYRWTISYSGDIRWSDANDSILDTSLYGGTGIGGMGTGKDIVLIGLDSIIVPEGLAGDYNDNGIIDAADYTVWRDALTAGSSSLENDSTPGVVDESDFTYWRNHFGETMGAGAGSASAAIPEPGSLVLGVLAVAGLLGFRRRS